MKAKEAIKIIGNWISEETHKRKYNKVEITKLSEALIHLKYITEQQDNRWTPVSERLPDNQQRVIVKCKRCPTVIGWLMHGEWHTDFGCMYKNYEVIAWQPLPETYREG